MRYGWRLNDQKLAWATEVGEAANSAAAVVFPVFLW